MKKLTTIIIIFSLTFFLYGCQLGNNKNNIPSPTTQIQPSQEPSLEPTPEVQPSPSPVPEISPSSEPQPQIDRTQKILKAIIAYHCAVNKSSDPSNFQAIKEQTLSQHGINISEADALMPKLGPGSDRPDLKLQFINGTDNCP